MHNITREMVIFSLKASGILTAIFSIVSLFSGGGFITILLKVIGLYIFWVVLGNFILLILKERIPEIFDLLISETMENPSEIGEDLEMSKKKGVNSGSGNLNLSVGVDDEEKKILEDISKEEGKRDVKGYTSIGTPKKESAREEDLLTNSLKDMTPENVAKAVSSMINKDK